MLQDPWMHLRVTAVACRKSIIYGVVAPVAQESLSAQP